MTLSATKTTTEKFTLANPGTLVTEFVTNGGATSGLQGDTVYVGQSKVGSPPNFVAGTPGTYATSVSLTGLYPFVSPNKYTVYAGDCEKNNPEVVTSKAVKDEAAQIEPGETTKVKVEEPQVNLVVMSGTGTAAPGTAVTSNSAKLTNTECKGSTSQNQATITGEHTIKVVGGRLEPAYAPYGKSFKVCVAWLESSSGKYYRNETTFANTAKTGSTAQTFYAKASGYTGPSSTALGC